MRSSKTRYGRSSGAVSSFVRPLTDGASSGAYSEGHRSSTVVSGSEVVAVASSVAGSIVEVDSSVAECASSVFKLISEGLSSSASSPGNINAVSSSVKNCLRFSDTRHGRSSGAVSSNIRPLTNRASSGTYSETDGSSTVGVSGGSEAVAMASITARSAVEVNVLEDSVAGARLEFVSYGATSSRGSPGNVYAVSSSVKSNLRLSETSNASVSDRDFG